jgi:hypothetical protein
MMRLERRASLLVAFSLLDCAATAHAECAWVLWQNPVTISSLNPTKVNSGDWKANDSFQSLEECRKSRDTLRKTYPPPKVEKVGLRYLEYACFPDTVDPRGPKK